MEPRIALSSVPAAAYAGMTQLQQFVDHSGLEPTLLELVKMRASQINGCAFCLDMHSKDALAAGETVQRLVGLDAWREAPYYSERERAALLWTEAVTRIADDQVPDAVFEQVKAHFSDREVVALTLAVVAINGWNRLAIALRAPAGSHRAAVKHVPAVS